YRDFEHLLEARVIFKHDRSLINHIDKKFAEGFMDPRLEEKVMEDWINKHLPTTILPIDANIVRIPIELMAKLRVDQVIREKISQFENTKVRSIMSSISKEQRKTIEISVRKIAKKHKVVGTCLYGSRVAGYARPESDYDLIIVLEDYAYILKYVYLKEAELELSALVVDRNSLE